MPVTYPLIGKGITTRVSTSISPPFGKEESAALRDMLEDLEPESTFEGLVASWEVVCQDLLDKANLPPGNKLVRVYSDNSWTDDVPEDWVQYARELRTGECLGSRRTVIERRYGTDSQEWFADQILQRINIVRKALVRDDTASVAHMALSLGQLIATATLKFTWEPDILFAQKRREEIQDRTRKSAHERGEKKQERRSAARKAADERWKNRPDRPISAVIRDLKKQEQFEDMEVNTLRGYLSKPEEWSTFKSRKQKT